MKFNKTMENVTNKALLIIDVQNDFVTGSLGSEYARDVVVPNIVELLNQFKQVDRFATLDTHFHETYLDTQEGRYLPIEHCIYLSKGWELVPELDNLIMSNNFINLKDHRLIKSTFGMDYDDAYIFSKYNEVHVCGLVTDICVVSNALLIKSIFPSIKIIVHENCCGGTSKENHDAAIKIMRSCQIDIVK